MAIHITTAGQAALALGPVTLESFKLGDSFGYVPDSGDTDIRGSQVLTGIPSAPVATDSNVYKYTISLTAASDLEFGEIALFMAGGGLFALISFASLLTKTSDPNDVDTVGGAIEVFIPASGTPYLDPNRSELLGVLDSVDSLPAAILAANRLYAFPNPQHTTIPLLAYRMSETWGFTNFSLWLSSSVDAATLNTITIDGVRDVAPDDLVQIISGVHKGIVRKVASVTSDSVSTTITFATPLTSVPAVDVLVHCYKLEGTGIGGIVLDDILQMGGNRITNLGTPQSSTDAATKAYADSIRNPRVFKNAAATGNITLNCALYDEFRLTLAGNVTLAFSGAVDGQGVRLKLKQSASSSYTVTMPASVRYNADIPSYTMTPTASKSDKLGLQYDGDDTKYDLLAVVQSL